MIKIFTGNREREDWVGVMLLVALCGQINAILAPFRDGPGSRPRHGTKA